MKIILSPTQGLPGQAETTVSVSGDTLTVDGQAYDLSAVPEGGEATPKEEDHPFIGKITRQDGTINATIRVSLGDDAKSVQPAEWSHWTINDAEGPVTIPVVRKEATDET